MIMPTSAEQVVAEEVPMLEDVLANIGLHRPGQQLDLRAIASPLEAWLQQQSITVEDRPFVASLVAAFVSQYLIAHGDAERLIAGNRIILRLPIQAGVSREIEPYALGLAATQGQASFLWLLEAYAPAK